MTVPVWPADLPQRPLRTGFSLGSPDGRRTVKMEKGPPVFERAFSSAVRPVQASFQVDLNGAMRFDRFWEQDTKKGALPFLLPDPRLHGVQLGTEAGRPLLTHEGAPLLISAWWAVMFGESAPEAVNTAGAWWRISFPLVVLP